MNPAPRCASLAPFPVLSPLRNICFDARHVGELWVNRNVDMDMNQTDVKGVAGFSGLLARAGPVLSIGVLRVPSCMGPMMSTHRMRVTLLGK